MLKIIFITLLPLVSSTIACSCDKGDKLDIELANFNILDCAKNSNLEGVKTALSQGANVNYVPNNPWAFRETSALNEAAIRHNTPMVQFLLENGADANLKLSCASTMGLGSEKLTALESIHSHGSC